MVHAADATYRRCRSLFRKIEKRELIATAHVKEDVSGSRIVPIVYNSRKAHPQHFDIETNGRFQVGADQREVIDATGLNRFRFSRPIRQIACYQLLSSLLVGGFARHEFYSSVLARS